MVMGMMWRNITMDLFMTMGCHGITRMSVVAMGVAMGMAMSMRV